MPKAQGSIPGQRVEIAASVVIYVALTVFLGRDVLANLATGIANDAGDPLFTAAILHWNARVLPLSHAWWQFPIFYPTPDTLAFSEHLLGLGVIATPISWITGNANVTYNVVTLLTFPLCAAAMFALVHRLTGSTAGAFVAGLAFAFSPYRISQLPHVQMLAAFWAPLALLGLHAYLASGKRRWLAVYGATWVLQAASNGYSLFFFSILIALWVAWFVLGQRRWRAIVEIAAATLVAVLPLVPVLFTYVTVHARHGFTRSVEEIEFFSADLAATLCAPPKLAFWGWLQSACRPEGELFPGAAVFLLAVLGVAYVSGWIGDKSGAASPRLVTLVRRFALAAVAVSGAAVIAGLMFGRWRIDSPLVQVSSSSIGRPLLIALVAFAIAVITSPAIRVALRRFSTMGFYLGAALATWALSLGPTIFLRGKPTGYAGPFALMMLLPGSDSLRVPARFWLMTTLCLAIVAGFVVSELLARRTPRVRILWLVAISAGVLADGWVPRIDSAPLPPPVPDPAALRGGVVLSLPAGDVRDVAPAYQAVVGGWKSVNGYSGYGPSYYLAVQHAVRAELDELFAPFRAGQDLHVVVPTDAPRLRALVERQPGVVMTAQTQDRSQYRLPRVPIVARPLGERLPVVGIEASCADGAAALIDVDRLSQWSCGAQKGSEAITADLGTIGIVGGVSQGLGLRAGSFPRELVIETSTDGSSWQTAWRGRVIAQVVAAALERPRSPTLAFPFDRRPARYVRLRQVGEDREFDWAVSGLEIHAGSS